MILNQIQENNVYTDTKNTNIMITIQLDQEQKDILIKVISDAMDNIHWNRPPSSLRLKVLKRITNKLNDTKPEEIIPAPKETFHQLVIGPGLISRIPDAVDEELRLLQQGNNTIKDVVYTNDMAQYTTIIKYTNKQ